MRKLHHLVALARTRHFGKAADACHVSQPAFSMSIQQLEEELGITLVQRGHRFIGFTPEGEKILLRARRLVAEWDALKQDASRCTEKLTGILRIGAIPTTLTIAPVLTQLLQAEHPGIRVQLYSLSTEQIMRQLDEFELDLGLTYLLDPRLEGFTVLPLYVERHVLLAPAVTGPNYGSHVDWREAAQLPLCLLTSNMQNRQLIDSAFRKAEVTPNIVVETDSILALYCHVRKAGLYSVVPHSLLHLEEMRQEIITLPIQPILTRQIGLITRRREVATPIQEAALRSAVQLDLQTRFDSLTGVC